MPGVVASLTRPRLSCPPAGDRDFPSRSDAGQTFGFRNVTAAGRKYYPRACGRRAGLEGLTGKQLELAPSYLTRLRRTGWLGRQDSNLCISESDPLVLVI